MLTLNNLNFFEMPAPQASPETGEPGETTENFAAILGGISALLQKPVDLQQNLETAGAESSVENLPAVENFTSANQISTFGNAVPTEPVSTAAVSSQQFPAQPDLLEKPDFNFKMPLPPTVPTKETTTAESAPDTMQATPESKTAPDFQTSVPASDSNSTQIEDPVTSTPDIDAVTVTGSPEQKELKFTTALAFEADAPNLEIPAQTEESGIFADRETSEVEILEIPKQAKVLPFAPKSPEPQFDILIAAPNPADAETPVEAPKNDEPPVDWVIKEENRSASSNFKPDVPIEINPQDRHKPLEPGKVKNAQIEPVRIEKPKFDVVKTETTTIEATKTEQPKVEQPKAEPIFNQPLETAPKKIKISEVLRQFSTAPTVPEEFHFDHPEIGQLEFAAHTLIDKNFEPLPTPGATEAPAIVMTQGDQSEIDLENFAAQKPSPDRLAENLDFEKSNSLWEQPSVKTPPVSDRQKTNEKNMLWQTPPLETPPIYDRQKTDAPIKLWQPEQVDTPPIDGRRKTNEKNPVLNSNQVETPAADAQEIILPQDFPKIVQSIRQNVQVKNEKKAWLNNFSEGATPQIIVPVIEEKIAPMKFTQFQTLTGGEILTGKGNPTEIKFTPTPRSMPEREFEAVKMTTAAGNIEPTGEKIAAPEQFWQPETVDTPPIIVREKPDLAGELPKIDRDPSPQFQIGQKLELAEIETRAPEATDFSEVNVSEQIEPRLIEIAGLVAKKDEKQILKMRLHPAELGTVEIKLEKNSDGVLEAQFQTDNEAAKQVLTQNLDKLRDALQDSGWQIGKMDVTQQSFSSEAQSQRQQEQPQKSELYQNDFPANPFARNADQHGEQDQDSARRLVSLRA